MSSRYNSSRLYDLRTRTIDSDKEAIRNLVGARRTFEVGCGTGRVLQWLVDWGAPVVTGVELDADKLLLAEERFKHDPRVTLMHGDFLDIAVEGSYERVLFVFNVIAEFVDVEARVRALRRAGSLLAAAGRIIVVASMHDFENYSRSGTSHDFQIGEGDDRWRVNIECKRDHIRQLSDCTVRYLNHRTGKEIFDGYTLALLTRNELLACYLAADLLLLEEYGSHSLDPVTGDSTTLVHVLGSRP